MPLRTDAAAFAIAFFAGLGATVGACASDPVSFGDAPDGGASGPYGGSADAAALCPLCVTTADCSGGVCAQFGNDSYCAPECPSGNECASDRACQTVTTADGQQKSVCVPKGDVCGSSVGPGSSGGSSGGGSSGGCGSGPPSDTCGSLDGPSVPSTCKCSSGHTCAANGCYGGWYCDTTTSRCQAPPSPSTCPPADAGSACKDAGGIVVDAGGPVSGQVGPTGGTVSRLLFAVVGDTRPAVINDTSAYPTPIITKIWQDVEAFNPRPLFAISTGDYVFSSANGTEAAPQMDLYLQARTGYSGIAFPAMGNHECTGATTSNCGQGNPDGVTVNYQTFLSKMLTPLGKTSPNYSIEIDAADGSWTAKFVFVAGNAWTSADATWLDGVLAKPTTYTFVVRHEPKAATAPGETGSEAIMAKYPYTLAIVGHTHTYGKTGAKQVTIGNGGAPVTGGANYGFGLLQQRADGAIQVDMIDYQTGNADGSFRFALKPDGSPAP